MSSADHKAAPRASDAPLLTVDKLTLRFRGLTAVDAVDLAVKPGEIFAVIGPNGAGKTSLFNAITGIYEPTSGSVALGGRDLCAKPTALNYVRWALAGLSVGLLLFLWTADINQLWSAVVKANYRNPKEGFQTSQALRDFGAFLAAKPRIEQKTGRWYVTTSSGQTPFGSAKTRQEAEAKRDAIPEMAELPADGSTIEEREGAFAIVSSDGVRVLDTAPTREMALDRLRAAREVNENSRAAVRKRIIALLLGCLLGAAGAWTVFRQTRRTPASVAMRGIARTFQNIRLFQDMTVEENVLVGMHRHLRRPAGTDTLLGRALALAPALALLTLLILLVVSLRFQWGSGLATVWFLLLIAGALAGSIAAGVWAVFSRRGRDIEQAGRQRASELLQFVGLQDRSLDLAKNLPYGAQRKLEIARALATQPTLLLLDEPAAGMNPAETVDLMRLIQAIRDRGTTILLIEHHMRVVMGISDRIAVLVYGQKIAEGNPDEIRNNAKVIEAYLGSEELG